MLIAGRIFPYTYLNKDLGEAKAMQLIQNETGCAIYVQVRRVITYGTKLNISLYNIFKSTNIIRP